ncbi:MAG: 16S rRNA (uracil(1498)-N(3))-methyltransferase [Rhodospirillaceae bacterium]|nr:16S rRNA (uracil(1498)-N(3))-methyltransferase [Rhodospirillaceae bacterium]
MSDRRRLRLFVDLPLEPGSAVVLHDDQAHYVVHVMRQAVGNEVLLFNGRDGEWLAGIAAVSKKACRLEVKAQFKPQAPDADVWLAFAPIKKARIDMVIEKATELGASVLWPVFTQHTNAERINLDRLRATAVEAAEQCERLTVPEVREAITFEKFVTAWPTDRCLFVLDETGKGRPLSTVVVETASRPCGFLVGPEGGFAQSELDALAQLPFVTRVGLGPRILRAETAALAALVCWQSLAGDWK